MEQVPLNWKIEQTWASEESIQKIKNKIENMIVPVNIDRYTYSLIKDDFAISIFQMKYKTQKQWQLEFKMKRCGTLN